jgi:hypothetical protein
VQYRTVSEARNMPGLRLVLTAGVPGPWEESAKSSAQRSGAEYGCSSAAIAGSPNPMPSNVNPMSEWFGSMYIAPSEIDAGRDPITS